MSGGCTHFLWKKFTSQGWLTLHPMSRFSWQAARSAPAGRWVIPCNGRIASALLLKLVDKFCSLIKTGNRARARDRRSHSVAWKKLKTTESINYCRVKFQILPGSQREWWRIFYVYPASTVHISMAISCWDWWELNEPTLELLQRMVLIYFIGRQKLSSELIN